MNDSRWRELTACTLLALALAPACGGSSGATPAGTDPTTDPSSVGGDAGSSDDGGKGELDAAPAPGHDAAAPVFDDGTLTRLACVATLGSGLSPTHGRLDGTLVSIVPVKAGAAPRIRITCISR